MRVSQRRLVAAVCAVLCLSAPAFPQDRDHERDRDRDRGPHAIVDRVEEHLRRAERMMRARGREQERYQNAQRHLSEFDQRLSRRQFDKGKLDTAIDDVKNVVENNSLNPEAKEDLSRDLAELRELRERFDRGELREFR